MNIANKPTFTPAIVERVGAIGRVLTDFLDKQAERIQGELENQFPGISSSAVRKVLNNFVSLEGTKRPLSKEKIRISSLSERVLTACLTALENARIIRYDEGLYELSHDTLARHIDEQRSAEEVDLLKLKKLVADRQVAFSATGVYLNQKELNFIAVYNDRLLEEELLGDEAWRYIETSKREAGRRQRLRWMTAAAVMLVLATSTIVALWQMRQARVLAGENARKSYEILVSQARAAFDRIEYEEARTLYGNALDLVRLNPGLLADQTSNVEAGIARSEEMINRKPAYLQLIEEGDQLRKQGGVHLLEARKKYADADSLDYHDSEAQEKRKSISDEVLLNELKLLEVGGDKMRGGDPSKAIENYEQALKINTVIQDPEIQSRINKKINRLR